MSHRILVISPAYSPVPGGLSEIATLLATTLKKEGCEVDVVTEWVNDSSPKSEVVDGISILRLEQPFSRGIQGILRISFQLIKFLLKNRKKYDLIIVRTVTSQAVVTGLLKWLRVIRARTVITSETGGEHDEISALKKYPLSKILLYFLKQNSYFNGINAKNLEHYRELGFPSGKVTKIYNGIDVQEYTRSEYPNSVKSFSFLGELNPEKGVRELLDAITIVVKQRSAAKLTIGGYGKLQDYVQEFIEQHGLENSVQFKGLIKPGEKRKFFMSADCFVFPSYSEGFGLVVAEAILYKRPVITTAVADFKTMYGDAITYVPQKNSHKLAEAMIHMMDSYKPGTTSYDQVIPTLDIHTVARQFIALLPASSSTRK